MDGKGIIKGIIGFQQHVGVANISSRISKSKVGDRILTKEEGNIPAGAMLLSNHSWAAREGNLSVGTVLLSYHSWLHISYLQPQHQLPISPFGLRGVSYLPYYGSALLLEFYIRRSN